MRCDLAFALLLVTAVMPSYRPPDAGRTADPSNAMNARLRGARLHLAWGVWAAAVLCGLILLIAFEPPRALQLRGAGHRPGGDDRRRDRCGHAHQPTRKRLHQLSPDLMIPHTTAIRDPSPRKRDRR